MSTRSTPWEPGTPCWADLASTDFESAQLFYAAVFDWQVNDLGEEFGHYSICTRNGLATAGVGPAMPGSNEPPAWTTYLAVEDVDKTAEAIAAHGGTLLAPPMTVADQGRMALAVDPTGAMFGIWQAEKMIGFQLVNEPGAVTWNDHSSADPAAAREFYAAVFGYHFTPMEGPVDYATIDGAGPGGTVGAIGQLDPGLPPGTPAHWTTYFTVDDADAAIEAATAYGGAVVAPAQDTPYGRMATLADAQGARFKIAGVTGQTPQE